jgi:predicted N-acetyltransferase YhbS
VPAIVERPDGIVLRTATPADVEQIVAMSIEAHGPKHEWGFRTVMAEPTAGFDRWVVAVDGDRVVSTLCLMQEAFRLAGPDGVAVEIPVGRPEYVATLPDYRRRRLIRDQLDVVHRWSVERGDLVQMILGIPYFYRRFGYEHGADYLHFAEVPAAMTMPEGWSVRRATRADIPELRRLRDDAVKAAGLSLVYTDAHWTQFVDDDPLHVLVPVVAEVDGVVAGAAYTLREHEGEPMRMAQVGADRLDGVRALTAWGQAESGGAGVAIAARPGTVCDAFLRDHGRHGSKAAAAYLRIADPVAFLDHIRPVLSARLAASPLRNEEGELVISLFSTGIRLTYSGGEVTGVEAAPGIEEPEDDGVVGVPPDQIVTLVMGRWGATGLEGRSQDVHLGTSRSLMETLFPRVVSDLATSI